MYASIDFFIHYLPIFVIDHIDTYMGIKTISNIQWLDFHGHYYRKYRPNKPTEIELPTIHLWKNSKGQLHRKNLPAYINYDVIGNVICEKYYDKDELHRIGGPAISGWNTKCRKSKEEWLEHNGHHKLDGPAIIRYDDLGYIRLEMWLQNGEHFRQGNMPDFIKYENGNITQECWFRVDADNPSTIIYSSVYQRVVCCYKYNRYIINMEYTEEYLDSLRTLCGTKDISCYS